MTLCKSTNNATGQTRYYMDGKRVSRSAFDSAQFWRTIDSLHSSTKRGVTRHWCCVR